jgi:hypothetical protein
MSDKGRFPLVTTTGQSGWVFRRSRFLDRSERSLVRLENGREFDVPSEALEVRPDGTFILHDPESEPTSEGHAEAAASPAPEPQVHRPQADGAFQLNQELFSDEVDIDRVSVNRLVDSPPETRQDGDITIVPVLEEVLVVQKRLLLKEEIRIRRTRAVVREPRRVFVDGDRARVLDARGDEIRS